METKSEPLPGVYCAVGIVPDFRFMQYQAGQAFKPHYDPSRLLLQNPGTGEDGHFRSMFTLACYLNDKSEFQGGEPSFIKLHVWPKRFERVSAVSASVGRCVVFDHKELHEGGELRAGTKHVMQCDVLYEWTAPCK